MTSYKSNNPSFKKKIMYFQMSKKWSIVATICGQYLARPHNLFRTQSHSNGNDILRKDKMAGE